MNQWGQGHHKKIHSTNKLGAIGAHRDWTDNWRTCSRPSTYMSQLYNLVFCGTPNSGGGLSQTLFLLGTFPPTRFAHPTSVEETVAWQTMPLEISCNWYEPQLADICWRPALFWRGVDGVERSVSVGEVVRKRDWEERREGKVWLGSKTKLNK